MSLRIVFFLILGLYLAGCGAAAPEHPDLEKKGRFVAPVEIPYGSDDAEGKEVPLTPLESGIALYSEYCSACHNSYETSNKRAIGISVWTIRSYYVMQFPRHRDQPWPKDEEEAALIADALAVAKTANSSESLPTIGGDEESSELPSL